MNTKTWDYNDGAGLCSVTSVLSNCMQPMESLWPCEQYSATLFCPRNSPGKNTGAGCRALLLGIFPTQELNPYLGHLPARKSVPCLTLLIGGERKDISTPGNKPAGERPLTCQILSFYQWTLLRRALLNSPFSSIKELPLCSPDLPVVCHRLHVPNCNSWLFPNKPILLVSFIV